MSLWIIRSLALPALFLLLATGPARASTLLTLGSGFLDPAGVAVDAQGDVFVADTNNNLIKEIVAVDGAIPASPVILTLGGAYPFSFPQDLALDSSGNIFVADTNNSAIEELTAASGYTSVTVLGGGFSFGQPVGITVDALGNVFTADQGTNALYELTAASGYNAVDTLGGGWGDVGGVAVDASGDVFVADQGGALWEILAANAVQGNLTPPTQLAGGGGFSALQGIALDAAGNVFVADYNLNTVFEVPAAGGYSAVNTVAASFNVPISIALDRYGNIYVADSNDHAIKEIQFVAPVPVPTLGQAALVLFFLLLAGTALRKTLARLAARGCSHLSQQNQ